MSARRPIAASSIRTLVLTACLLSGPAFAINSPGDALEEVGYRWLARQLGDALPRGEGVLAGQVEPLYRPDDSTPPAFAPDPAHPSLTNITWLGVSRTGSSRHATTVASLFYGSRRSLAPGVRAAAVYSTRDFLQVLAQPPDKRPVFDRVRVWNHSWVGGDAAPQTARLLAALDAAALAHDSLPVVGVNNDGPVRPLLSGLFNGLAVGRSDGLHATGTARLQPPYGEGGVRPHLVAPQGTTSAAVPMVASAALLLSEVLAARDELHMPVLKAALLAAADPGRVQPDGDEPNAANGLHPHFGAGQLDVARAWRILALPAASAVQEGSELARLAPHGYAMDDSFGGLRNSRREVSFRIRPEQDGELVAVLFVPARITPRAARLFAVELTAVGFGASASDGCDGHVADALSSELRLSVAVQKDQDCVLRVAATGSDFRWRYALAWTVRERGSDRFAGLQIAPAGALAPADAGQDKAE